jgi:hypothetical protein
MPALTREETAPSEISYKELRAFDKKAKFL